MTSINHFLVFIGASPSLSTEILRISRRFTGTQIVAPAMGKADRVISKQSISRSVTALVEKMREASAFDQPARLSVWAYQPESVPQMEALWREFGSSAWIEFVPSQLKNKDSQSRNHVETRIKDIVQSLHEVSTEVSAKRKSSPLPLPLRNFKSDTTISLSNHWYSNANLEELKTRISQISNRFRMNHANNNLFRDSRNLVFSPAIDSQCHGKPHPTGDDDRCFIAGRFRFGAALFSGFHYDVSTGNDKPLASVFYDCCGNARDVRSERRNYLNVFPNDHLLPLK